MNAKGNTPTKETRRQMPVSTLMHWSGISAMLAGLCFLIMGVFKPLNDTAFVTTPAWINVHSIAFALGFIGLLGMAGVYARQAKKSGWLGLAGFLLLSAWIMLQSGFSFVDAFILPHLVTESPRFVEGFLGMFNGVPSEIDLGILPTLYTVSNPMYLLGPMLFGIATIRAGILPRGAGALLVVGAMLAPVSALVLPPAYQPWVMVPIGLALAWLGYALFSERREKTSESLLGQRTVTQEPDNAA
jgi:hypothetical protein